MGTQRARARAMGETLLTSAARYQFTFLRQNLAVLAGLVLFVPRVERTTSCCEM
jgi:hypothetical protein